MDSKLNADSISSSSSDDDNLSKAIFLLKKRIRPKKRSKKGKKVDETENLNEKPIEVVSVVDEEEVHFPSTGRDSPRLELLPDNITPTFICRSDKIFRMKLLQPFVAQLMYFTSPSSIYVRPKNHITSQLELTNAYNLNPAVPNIYNYVMAPLTTRTLGRARILGLNDDRTMAYVYFIDHGEAAAIDVNDLFGLPSHFHTFPWQTIPVKLYGAVPQNKKAWTDDEVSNLSKILSHFKLFWIKPVKLFDNCNLSEEHVTANITGLREAEITDSFFFFRRRARGYSIAESLCLSFDNAKVMYRKPMHGALQPSYPLLKDKFFENLPHKTLDRDYMLKEICKPLPFWQENPFPQFSSDFSDTFVFNGNKLWVFTINNNMEAHPNRFYGFRLDTIDKDTEMGNHPNRIRRFVTETAEMSQSLSKFYYDNKNLQRLNFLEVVTALKEGKRVYGIVEKPQKSVYFDFYFQRVQILHCILNQKKNYAFRVLMMDTGYIDHIAPSFVYHIHSQHLVWYPFSTILTFTNLLPFNKNENQKWSADEHKYFNFEAVEPMKAYEVDIDVEPDQVIDLTKPIHVRSMKRVSLLEKIPVERLLLDNSFASTNDNSGSNFDVFRDIRFDKEPVGDEGHVAVYNMVKREISLVEE